jgi:hypothetical protein
MRPAVALLALAALAWLLRSRDRPLPKPASTTEPEDDVQGPDPVTYRVLHRWDGTVPAIDLPPNGTGDVWPQPWVNTSNTGIDPTYLEEQAVAIRRGAQGPDPRCLGCGGDHYLEAVEVARRGDPYAADRTVEGMA